MQLALIDRIIQGPTSVTAKGFPFINEASFRLFQEQLPHLFCNGLAILDYLRDLNPGSESEARAKQVIEAMVLTAAVTAPSDLWLLKHILSAYAQIGLLPDFCGQREFSPASLAREHALNDAIMKIDFSFLKSRGYLREVSPGSFSVANHPSVRAALKEFKPYPVHLPIDMIEMLGHYFANAKNAAKDPVTQIFQLPEQFVKNPDPAIDWVPSLSAIEIGSRILPIVLSLRQRLSLDNLQVGTKLSEILGATKELIRPLFLAAGFARSDDTLTLLGVRTLQRGPGPMGIIHAYHTYLSLHVSKLKNQVVMPWVARGANVAASQDANARTFSLANDNLDRYCRDHNWSFTIFIEHAVGKGEATRQRFERSGEQTIRYFGADLEDAAIDQAIAQQKDGLLPKNMRFLRHADIGKPELLLGFLRSVGADPCGAVMLVGNGFHEVRGQSDASMIEVFRGYCDAGVLLIFTEESGLDDEDLLRTGFNTYHAGFRYVHELSGQGLRPVYDLGVGRMSWASCARSGGYNVLDDYTARTRTIYPYPREDGRNPAISVTYFCVPQSLK